MDLCYIWVKEFKNIKEQGFTFGGKYTFSFDRKNNLLEVRVNKDYIPYFFVSKNWQKGDGVVSSVTAIIGENGSGKSNILEFFCDSLRAGDSFSPARKLTEDIILFENQKRFFVYANGKIKKYSLLGESKEKHLIDLNKPEEEFQHAWDTAFMHQLISIFYSTTWVDRITLRDIREWELINISNSHDYYYSHFPPIATDHLRKTSYIIITHPSRHLSEDAKRQIFFLEAYKDWLKDKLNFQIVKDVGFGILQKYTHGTSDYDRYKYGHYKELFKLLFETYQPTDDYVFSKLFFSAASLLNYVLPSGNVKEFKTPLWEEFKKCITENPEPFIAYEKFLINHPLNIPPKYPELWGKKVKMDDYKIPETIEYLKFVNTTFDFKNLAFNREDRHPLDDYIKNKTFNPIVFRLNFHYAAAFLEYYLNHLEREVTPDYLHFESLNYSSGELSFLNLFSRLPHIAQNVIQNFERFNMVRWAEAKNIILMIDEGETYLHPQWQKLFLKYLLEFSQKVFKEKWVQIILTSHSPLFISDLPKNNIIFLKRKENGECIVSDIKEQKTFASNIHSLYADSFFVQDGLIGEFAKGKISDAVKRLTSEEDLSENESTEIKNIRPLAKLKTIS